MSNNKQGSVKWLFEQVCNLDWKNIQGEKKLEILEQAKAMHKEEMEKVAGDFWNEGASYVSDGQRKYNSFDEYYNETYESNT